MSSAPQNMLLTDVNYLEYRMWFSKLENTFADCGYTFAVYNLLHGRQVQGLVPMFYTCELNNTTG